MTVSYYTTSIVTVDCGECGIPHGLPTNVHELRLKDGQTWYCPNGHKIAYGNAENERLRRENKALKDSKARIVAERDQIEASRRAWKGQATKYKNRAVAGTCPFCGQHLRDLERHVQRQHADQHADPA